MNNIVKTIIPAAGLGTRFLPLTKTLPKEMLPLLDKPAIHHIIHEAVLSGIRHMILITNKDRDCLMNYFDADPALDQFLRERNKQNLINELDSMIETAQFTYIRQNEPRGLGHAIAMAESLVCDQEYISIMLPDDIIVNSTPGLSQLIAMAKQEHASVIAVQEVPLESISSYGVVGIKEQLATNLYQVSHLVEKPAQQDAPSNLAIIGRYVLSSKIFPSLYTVKTKGNQEIQLTDGISHMLGNGEKVYAYKIQGNRYDIGTPMGWLSAIIALGLEHKDYKEPLKKLLSSLDQKSN